MRAVFPDQRRRRHSSKCSNLPTVQIDADSSQQRGRYTGKAAARGAERHQRRHQGEPAQRDAVGLIEHDHAVQKVALGSLCRRDRNAFAAGFHSPGCYAGFWIFGQSRIGVLDLMLASQHAEPISIIASTIADAYPLPPYFKPGQAIAVASAAPLSGQSAPANIKGLLLGLYELRAVLSAIETAAFPARAGAALSLMMSNNEIDAIATTVDGGVVSGAAVFVAANQLSGDRPAGFSSTIICDANKARNRTAEFPTVAIYAGPECSLTATGNLVFNHGAATTGAAAPTSLFVTGGGGTFTPAGAPPVIAVTGNVFRAPPSLPPRSLPAPLNTWDVFNTVV
jgi:hypothetical protein